MKHVLIAALAFTLAFAPVIVKRGHIICPDAIGTTGGRGHVRACLIVKSPQPPAPLHR